MHELIRQTKERQHCMDNLCSVWISDYKQRGGTIYCARGCRGCCTLVVNCAFPEAMLIASSLTGQQVNQLEKQVRIIKDTAERVKDMKQWLAAYRNEAGPCPFLEENGSCGIYPVRPLSCRSLLSTKSPDWCSADFSRLNSQEKQAFMDSLDLSVVAYPTHYAATIQEIGAELEKATLRQMSTDFGFSITGSLPWLVWIEHQHSLSGMLHQGCKSVEDYLDSNGLINKFLVAELKCCEST